ncbi:MAG: BON domain-containing protein [Gemmatimonadaceae bacterium]|nr:BON domain-containing protein [Gemmatimonadaceae bacterium]
MSPFRYRDEESRSTSALYVALGALAGFAAGVVVAQQYGGISGLTAKIRDRLGSVRRGAGDDDEQQLGAHAHDHRYEDEDEDGDDDDEYEDEGDGEPLDATEELEERVLEAFRNDPILSERAIDIGAIDEGIVELTGWVNADDESQQAVVIARGVPGVETVVNRLAVRADEDLFDELADRYDDGDPSLTEGQWEGQSIGTGRRRQGTSAEPDRHEDPRPGLEEKVLDRVYLDPDDEAEAGAERRKRTKQPPRRGRADGSPVAPTGVPKSDHVADPLSAPTESAQGD